MIKCIYDFDHVIRFAHFNCTGILLIEQQVFIVSGDCGVSVFYPE
jgi:hypothetical protein